MTREEAIKFAEYAQIMADGKPDVQEFYNLAEGALRAQQEHTCPCDLCNFGPPSSMRGKPCTMCPAVPRQERNDPLTLDELRKMDGEPVWVICDKGFEPIALCALVEVCEESIFLTNNLGGRTEYAADVELEDDSITAYRQKPEETV